MICVLCHIKKEREKIKICIHIKDIFVPHKYPVFDIILKY